MKKYALVFMLIASLFVSAANADTLRLYSMEGPSEEFKKNHPDLEIIYNDFAEDDFRNTYEILSALLTGSFKFDIFGMGTYTMDIHQIMDKGYCEDLSQSETIKEAFNLLYPNIAKELIRDGKIYAVPKVIQCETLIADKEGWQEAGYTQEDVPQSFPELLDFLENWCRRASEEPNDSIKVKNTWDETLYGPYNYTVWLAQMLVESHIMQCEYAKAPLRFNDEEFLELLSRCKEVGTMIYETEPEPNAPFALVEDYAATLRWEDGISKRKISVRLNDSQPKLFPAKLDAAAVYSRSGNKELAVAVLEDFVTQRMDERWNKPMPNRSLLYKDAPPIKNGNQEYEIESAKRHIAEIQEKLKDDSISLSDREDLEVQLVKFEDMLERSLQREYDLSPEDLADYRLVADDLFFPTPGPFNIATDTGQNVLNMIDRFAAGNMSAQEFVTQLDRMARMVELEEQ